MSSSRFQIQIAAVGNPFPDSSVIRSANTIAMLVFHLKLPCEYPCQRQEDAAGSNPRADAWDLAAWLVWRWTPHSSIPFSVGARPDREKLETALLRIKSCFGDPASFALLSRAEWAMLREMGRPADRSVLELPMTPDCMQLCRDNGLHPFNPPFVAFEPRSAT